MSEAPLAVTLGDPAGVGPEIVAAAWHALKASGPIFFAVGDAAALVAAGAPIAIIADASEAAGRFAEALPVLDVPLPSPPVPGRPSAEAAPFVVRWIEAAVQLALEGAAAGVVTAPIAKATLYEAGFAYPWPHRVHRRADPPRADGRRARSGDDADRGQPARQRSSPCTSRSRAYRH